MVQPDLITYVLSGGFAGAAIVALLFKFLIYSQLEKSLKQYQHDLDTKKDSLQAELSVYTEHAKLRLINHRQKTISALEAVYGSFIRTSLPRQQFRKSMNRLKPDSSEDEINSAYFKVFSDNFQAFSRAFSSVVSAFQCLEDNSIYLDQKLETQVAKSLGSVNACYQKWHAELERLHDLAQESYRKGELNHNSRDMNFELFFGDLAKDWAKITHPVTLELKLNIRNLLGTESTNQHQL